MEGIALNSKESLGEAFQAFIQASGKLQKKYDKLAKETQALRKQLALKEEEIKKSERLVMLGKTAAGIAHEVRNPLGAIKLFISLLKQDLESQPSALELIAEIEKSATILDGVVSNILHFAKNTQPVLMPVNMHVLLREQLKELQHGRLITQNIELSLAGNPYIKGHELSLKQVINNLVINALQAKAEHIKVSYDNLEDCRGRLIIADDGSGIPQAVLDNIFDPFVSTKNDGTGLGLAIVKRILDQHGACISVKNCQGACFTVIFPV